MIFFKTLNNALFSMLLMHPLSIVSMQKNDMAPSTSLRFRCARQIQHDLTVQTKTSADLEQKLRTDSQAYFNLLQRNNFNPTKALLEIAETGEFDFRIAHDLLESGALVNASTDQRRTSLMLAAQRDDVAFVTVLLNKNADILKKDLIIGNSALVYAAQSGSVVITKLFLNRDMHVDIMSTMFYSTALMEAARYGCYDVAQFLIEKGANVNHTDLSGETPLTSAIRGESWKIVQLLLENGAEKSVNQPIEFEGETPLIIACVTNAEIVSLLLKYGAVASHITTAGKHPLLRAAAYKHKDIVDVLLKAGQNINQKNSVNQTALSIACEGKNLELVIYLLEHGADIETKDSSGQTPLFIAINKKDIPIIQALIAQGANLHAITNSGETILECAQRISLPVAKNIRRKMAIETFLAFGNKLPLEVAQLIASFYK